MYARIEEYANGGINLFTGLISEVVFDLTIRDLSEDPNIRIVESIGSVVVRRVQFIPGTAQQIRFIMNPMFTRTIVDSNGYRESRPAVSADEVHSIMCNAGKLGWATAFVQWGWMGSYLREAEPEIAVTETFTLVPMARPLAAMTDIELLDWAKSHMSTATTGMTRRNVRSRYRAMEKYARSIGYPVD